MKKKSKNSKIIILLSVISLLIWSGVVFQLRKALNMDSRPAPESADRKILSHNSIGPDSYHDSLFAKIKFSRNPFQKATPAKTLVKRNLSSTPRQTSEKLPEITYSGYIAETTGPLALLEFKDGETVICRVGDVYQKISIRKINNSDITLIYNGKSFTISLLTKESDR